MSRVKTPAWRPNLESFAISSASPKSEKRSIVATGPKISSHQTLASCGGAPSRVGARQRPSSTSSPPVSSSAPAATASSIHSLTRSRSSGVISGPTSVSGSSGSPTRSFSTLATSRSVNGVGDRLVDEDPLDRDAALAGVGEGVDLGFVGGRLPVAVVVDDQRRVGAELEVDLLVRDLAADPPADRRPSR